MLVQKLRLYAMIMRLQELEQERIEERNNRLRFQFDRPPITLTRMPTLEPLISLYDKKGNPFELPKSKYHK
jgi:hypothetical protein